LDDDLGVVLKVSELFFSDDVLGVSVWEPIPPPPAVFFPNQNEKAILILVVVVLLLLLAPLKSNCKRYFPLADV